MDKEPTEQVVAKQTEELKSPSKEKTPRKYVVFILVMLIATIVSLAFAALFYRQNNLLKGQIKKSINTTTIDNIKEDLDSPTPTPGVRTDTANTSRNLTHSQVDSCSSESCLFIQKGGTDIGTPEGFAYLQGYFYEYEADDWGTLSTCTGFVVTGGNETLITHFNDWIEGGNNLNKILDGKLVANIDINQLEVGVKDLITSSKEDSPIEIGVIRITPVGRGASTCSSVIDIVTAK